VGPGAVVRAGHGRRAGGICFLLRREVVKKQWSVAGGQLSVWFDVAAGFFESV
jgi:hypothetical protein